jgi:DNA-directed RNA polymerase subunit RPC12/RpoP
VLYVAFHCMANDDVEDAVKEVDRMEDEAAAKRQGEADAYDEKSEDDVIICPKCKSLVNEGDFAEDQVSEMASTSIMSKIHCPKCGYVGLPVEVTRAEYKKYGESPKE